MERTRVKMARLAKTVESEFPGMGFAVFIFPFHTTGDANYISNAHRKDMVTALREKANIFEKQMEKESYADEDRN